MSYRGPFTGLFATLLVVALFGFVYTFWLTLPIGVVSGWIHERAITEH
jgi:hypothetical protein